MRWHSSRLVAVTIAILAAITMIVSPHLAHAQATLASEESALSSYWHSRVRRWEPIVVRYAESRGLDPDLVAAVIWKESLGDSTARGPTGAVGLMGLKPFPWRPSPEQLENPWTNLFWGARALAHTIRDGNGDIYYSLAAYNGGWEKIHNGNTRRYAGDVLGHYVRAVAVRHGLPADGDWTALIAIQRPIGFDTFIVLGPQRELVRYTERPCLGFGVPEVPKGASPHAIAATSTAEQGIEYRVNVWLVTQAGAPVASSRGASALSLSSKPLAAIP